MPKLRFSLNISAREFQRFYQGDAGAVLTVTDDGQQLQFPAAELRAFVSHAGVHGRFEIEFDAQHKLKAIRKLGD